MIAYLELWGLPIDRKHLENRLNHRIKGRKLFAKESFSKDKP